MEQSQTKGHAINDQLAHAVKLGAEVEDCGGGQRNSSAEDGLNAPGTQLRSWGAHVPPMKAKKAVMAKMAT